MTGWVDPAVVHLLVGPPEHGVNRHAALIARGCGHDVLRCATDDLRGVAARLPAAAVVHVGFTDRLFGATAERAREEFLHLADGVAAAGAALSVTLHDVPHDDSPLQARRRETYRAVIGASRGVVVNSGVELALVEDLADTVHSLRVALLPIEPAQTHDGASPAHDERPAVTVLGFVFPDRGYEQVIDALPEEADLVAVGRPSDGHEDLPARYADLAGGRWRLTGYVPDGELAGHLWAAAVPVAPNRRVTASASINTWLAHGRVPLVPDGPYARELDRTRPGTVRLYDPDDPRALADAIRAALDDPSLTRLAEGVRPGPGPDESVAVYREHLRACRPPTAVAVGGGRLVVPGNRWDLVDATGSPPEVTVVIPYYEAQRQLDLVLAGLAGQTHPSARLEVVVVDDGSRRPPDLSWAGNLTVVVRRQDDRGFRAAAARNLGASVAGGDVLVFLDGDTVPEPGYVEELTRLPARCPDVVTVGRRRHADLATIGPADVVSGVGTLRTCREYPEPGWLADAYRSGADLLHADRRSYRYLISAVMAVGSRLFAEVGGFDERFVDYGGEDWDLAHRCWVAGAVFAHVLTAVAWHDGPDWAGRETAATAKNPETVALAALLPDPDLRGPGSWSPYPAVAVTAPAMDAASALGVVRSALAGGADCGFWFDAVDGAYADLVLADPRVATGRPSAEVLARAPWRATVHAPADLTDLARLCAAADRHDVVSTPAVTVAGARVRTRGARWARSLPGVDAGTVLFGRHDRSAPIPLTRPVDLSAELTRAARQAAGRNHS